MSRTRVLLYGYDIAVKKYMLRYNMWLSCRSMLTACNDDTARVTRSVKLYNERRPRGVFGRHADTRETKIKTNEKEHEPV